MTLQKLSARLAKLGFKSDLLLYQDGRQEKSEFKSVCRNSCLILWLSISSSITGIMMKALAQAAKELTEKMLERA